MLERYPPVQRELREAEVAVDRLGLSPNTYEARLATYLGYAKSARLTDESIVYSCRDLAVTLSGIFAGENALKVERWNALRNFCARKGKRAKGCSNEFVRTIF